MRRALHISLFLLLLSPAGAISTQMPEEVREAIQAYLADCWPGAEVSWTMKHASRAFAAVESDDGRVVIEGARKPRGDTVVNVEYRRNGEVFKRIPVAIEVHPLLQVPLLKEEVRRKQPLKAGDLTWELRDAAEIRGDWPTRGELATGDGLRATRRLRAGNVLLTRDIEPVPDVVQGSSVVIRSHYGQVVVETVGEALQDGHEGEKVRVENPAYRVILRGEVAGPGLVDVIGMPR